MQPMRASYPATFTFDPPEKIANWRPLVQWILAIPHFVVLYVLGLVSQVLGLVSWLIILFTGNLPEGIANFQALYIRYSMRVGLYSTFLVEEYPPFSFDMATTDPGDVPRARVDIAPELTNRNRVTCVFRLLLAIPQFVVVAILGIGAWIAFAISFFAVLFTGSWPGGLRDYVIKVYRWNVRLQTYLLLLTDVYPPFSLD